MKSRTGSTLYDALCAGRGQYIYAPRALPIIRLKKGADEDDESLSNYLALPDSDEIRLMEANLSKYNAFLEDHWLDLIMPDGDFDALLRYNWAREPRGFGERRRIVDLDLYLNRKLHRVFNNGRIDHGGRFYGGWWQNLPKQFRKCIAINGLPTVEADFSAMQLNMLYALEGLSPPEKSYELEGFPPAERDFLKRSFFKLINAEKNIQAPRKEELPVGWTWKMVQDGLCELHRPIAKYLKSGKGIELQRMDSDIAESVMLTMMQEGILALPVHDSFIVWHSKKDRLIEVMKDKYQALMSQAVEVKPDVSWMDENLPPDAKDFNDEGVRFYDDFQADIVERPEYASYRKRLSDFVKDKGEAWGHRHSFYR